MTVDDTNYAYTLRMPNSLNQPPNAVKLLIAPPVVAMQEFLAAHKDWIENLLLCRLADAITFEFYLPFHHHVLSQMFCDLPVDGRSISYSSALKPIVQKWETPPDVSPQISLGMSRDRTPGVAKGKFGWALDWNDTPLAVWLKGATHPLIYCSVPYAPHTNGKGPSSRSLLIVNKKEMSTILRLLETIEPPKRIRMLEGRDILLAPDGYCWDSIVLSPDLDTSVRQDFDSFFRREEWFRRHNLPYRRGYLLYGPPGNGKTSVARVMACHPAIRAFGIDFRASQKEPYSPEQIADLFEAASEQAPSLVILEDIDKVAANDPEAMQYVVNGLLSCMDGLASDDGVIVVATANDPSPLGNTLLKRPGRFDRVVRFPLPTADLRQDYLVLISGGSLSHAIAAEAALAMDRFSFAQIREAYIVAGQLAFERDAEIESADLTNAAKQLRRESSRSATNGRNGAVGFSVEEVSLT